MINIKWVRENCAWLDLAMTNRGKQAIAHELVELDSQHRKELTQLQELQNQRHRISQAFTVPGADKVALKKESDALKQQIADCEEKEKHYGQILQQRMLLIPNIPAADCPLGKDENDNVEIRRVGKGKETGPDHMVVAGSYLDAERAAQMSGSRFTMLYGPLAQLERALAQWMLDHHTTAWGYQEVSVPLLVRPHALEGTGQLPALDNDMFHTNSGHCLIPTGEVPLTNIVADSIIDEFQLPLRFTTYTPCFRLEAGAAGRDTQGMIRQHQFGKVELVSITTPDKSVEEHERMTSAAEDILKQLNLPYRVMALCTGDMGFASEKTYDIEVWLPSQGRYREISSCSRCSDFQARRLMARYRPVQGGKPQFVHTLNGSGVAVGRALIAVLENYGDADGTVEIPAVLRPYMKGQEKIFLKNI